LAFCFLGQCPPRVQKSSPKVRVLNGH